MNPFANITHIYSMENYFPLHPVIHDFESLGEIGLSLKEHNSHTSVEVVNSSVILLLFIPIVIIDDFEQFEK